MNLLRSVSSGHFADFGMDTITLAGPLEAKLAAMKAAGFGQVMLAARDIVGHPQGIDAAVAAVKASGLRVTGFQVLRDFEGLSGHLHGYKADIAKQMIGMARALGAKVLLACSSTSQHASGDLDVIARDLRKLAMLALPHGIQVAFEALSWGRTHQRDACRPGRRCSVPTCPNLGMGVDSTTSSPPTRPLDEMDDIDPARIFLVQLADFMWQEARTFAGTHDHRAHLPGLPGRGRAQRGAGRAGAQARAAWATDGDYSFEVFNDDYVNLPLPVVCERARRSAIWLSEDVLRRSTPLPNAMRLKARPA
jgi:sugar phosphate isomerase/epimerase